jgi:hypothetical protein
MNLTTGKNETIMKQEDENITGDNATFYFLTLLMIMLVTFSLFKSEILYFIFLKIF